jgi:hypothetical protein
MQIPAGKIYGLLLGMALRAHKGVEHGGTRLVAGGGEWAFSARLESRVAVNFRHRVFHH